MFAPSMVHRESAEELRAHVLMDGTTTARLIELLAPSEGGTCESQLVSFADFVRRWQLLTSSMGSQSVGITETTSHKRNPETAVS